MVKKTPFDNLLGKFGDEEEVCNMAVIIQIFFIE